MNKNILTIAMMFFILASCQSEENIAQDQDEIRLTSSIETISRGISSTQQSTQIVSGQGVGVIITGAKDEHVNVKWTVGNNGVLENSNSTPLYWKNTDVTIYAYHPYDDSWSGINQLESFSVNTDQSTDEGYLNSDLLWSTKTASKSSDPIELDFVHKLAKINVTLQSEYQTTDLSNATISICGTQTTIGFNPYTGELSGLSAPKDIVASITEENAYRGSAIIVPQKVNADTKFIKITHNNKNFYYTLPSETEYETGNSYNYTLMIKEKETEVELISGNITPWITETNIGDANEEITAPYVTFVAKASQTLTMSKSVASLQYSLNGGEWLELADNTVEFGGDNGFLRIRGKSSIGTATSISDYATIVFGTDAEVSCTGDIRTLIDWENYPTVNTSTARFCSLFRSCKTLKTAPDLPAETLAEHSYAQMFTGCSSLIEAPELPAKSVPACGYYHMFSGCESLEIAPELPAMTVGSSGYNTMFSGCTSLVNAPELPATTLTGENHYACMFMNCTSLENTPKILPSMIATLNCYANMFDGCINITSAPELPATTLDTWCYDQMFKGCVKLVNIPEELPAKKLAVACYNDMFSGCKSLKDSPKLPATTLAQDCYSGMFIGCTSLENVPELPALELATGCYSAMFNGCTSLKVAPKLEAKTLVSNCYVGMFNGCSNLNEITMLATNISAFNCLYQWVKDVAATGTFYKASTMNSLTQDEYDYDGIPAGDWTVKNYEE